MRRRHWAALFALTVAGGGGCTLGPIWSPPVSGRVIAASTGLPVAGAEVEVCYRVSLVGTHGSSVDVDLRRATTDADGRFHVPPHPVRAFLEIGGVPRYPDVRATHPLYGSGVTSFHYPDDRFPGWDRIEVELPIQDEHLDAFVAGVPNCDGWEPWICYPE